ncbi:MAG: hypothetical protein P1V20_06920 [Verrucomicrobiales bacterium]|nr:hypothetical protein [Verrucomicrobiales bacterium]
MNDNLHRKKPHSLHIYSRLAAIALGVVILLSASNPLYSGEMDQSSDWPRVFTGAGGHEVMIYQPQVNEVRNEKMAGRVAFGTVLPGHDKPTYGSAVFHAELPPNREGLEVTLRNIEVTTVNLPGAPLPAAMLVDLVNIQLEGKSVVLESSLITAPVIEEVDKGEVTIAPTYQGGEPQYAPVEGTENLQYVTNSAYEIVVVDDVQYCCYAGVWYTSGVNAAAWAVAEEVADVIYTIPPYHPLHHLTYCQVHGQSGGAVAFASTSGYHTVVGGGFHGENVSAFGVAGPQHQGGVVTYNDNVYVGVDGQIYTNQDGSWSTLRKGNPATQDRTRLNAANGSRVSTLPKKGTTTGQIQSRSSRATGHSVQAGQSRKTHSVNHSRQRSGGSRSGGRRR